MYELEEGAASPEQDRGNMPEETEQQITDNHPPPMKLIKLSTNGTHQIQPQECPVQVVQQPLQYPTYLAPVYNTQGQIIMNKNVAFHSANMNQSIQIITEGKPFQTQVPQVLLQGKPVVQGFSRYATIPTSEYNQAVVISPIEAGNSLLSPGLEQQKESQGLSKMIITKSRPDSTVMVTGWDQNNILNSQPQTVGKTDIIRPQIMNTVQCSYELQNKTITQTPLPQSSADWKKSATSQDLTWFPGAVQCSSLKFQEKQNSIGNFKPKSLLKTLINNPKKNRNKKTDKSKNLKIIKSYKDIKVIRRGQPKYTYSRVFSKNVNTTFPEVTSTIDERIQNNEKPTQAKSTEKPVSPILEKNEDQTANSTTMCSDASAASTEKSLPLKNGETDTNLSLPIPKQLAMPKEDELKPEELEDQSQQPSLQFKTEETQTFELWKGDNSSSTSNESFEEGEKPEPKEESPAKEEDPDHVDTMIPQKAIIKPQASSHIIENTIIQEPTGSFLPNRGCKDSGVNQISLRQREKIKKLYSKKAFTYMTKVIRNQKLKKVSIFHSGFRSKYNNRSIFDKKKVIVKKNKKTGDKKKKSLTTNTENVDSKQFAQDEQGKVDASNWTVNEVCDFIRSLPDYSHYAENFALQDVDGKALMLLDTKHLMSMMSMKLGPAVKLMAKIKALEIPDINQLKNDG